jgi:hypothetical protein
MSMKTGKLFRWAGIAFIAMMVLSPTVRDSVMNSFKSLGGNK